MDLELTTKRVLEISAMMKNVDKMDLEFDNYKIAHELSLINKSLEVYVDAFNLLNKPSADYKKYLRAHETAKNKFANNLVMLKAEQDKIEAEYVMVKEQEMDRLDSIESQLIDKVVVKNINKIDRLNASGEPTIKGKGAKELRFLMVIEPFFKE